MPTLDRMKDKHNDQVKQLARVSAKRDKLITSLVRIEAQRISLIRAVARSSKRLDKARSLAALNAPLPDAKPGYIAGDLGALTPEQADKVIASEPLPVFDLDNEVAAANDRIARKAKPPVSDVTNIPVSDFLGHGDALADRLPSDNKPVRAVPLSKLHRTKQGKANAESWNAIPAVAKAKRKSRRTPDDFVADMAAKKGSATRGRIAD
jgi:hypothetical protein